MFSDMVIDLKCFFCSQGLKTGMYYLRTKPAANPIQFTVDQSKLRNRESSNSTTPVKSPDRSSDDDITAERRNQINQQASKNLEVMLACSRENGDACLACSSWEFINFKFYLLKKTHVFSTFCKLYIRSNVIAYILCIFHIKLLLR